jgi:hypothetical protein
MNYVNKKTAAAFICLLVKCTFLTRINRMGFLNNNSNAKLQLLQVLLIVAWLMHILACMGFVISSETDGGWAEEMRDK